MLKTVEQLNIFVHESIFSGFFDGQKVQNNSTYLKYFLSHYKYLYYDIWFIFTE